MTRPARAALGLGSNLGDRRAHLSDAIDRISNAEGIEVVAVSPIVETLPVGGPSQPEFLNMVAIVQTTLSPEEVLALSQACETAAGRVRTVRWGPRTLDVDVLAYDAVTSGDDRLTLPHPRALERSFVLVPWAAVDPDFVVNGRTVAAWAADVGDDGVRWFDGSES
jgi:2-amino-4-hydroxy-6-hydroxymethyldihydropteridine diphosphokinase